MRDDDAHVLAMELSLLVNHLGPKPQPDQVDALARLVMVLPPPDRLAADATLHAIAVIGGRCPTYPSRMMPDELGYFDAVMDLRAKQARKLGAS
jgi:hypothetical protein